MTLLTPQFHGPPAQASLSPCLPILRCTSLCLPACLPACHACLPAYPSLSTPAPALIPSVQLGKVALQEDVAPVADGLSQMRNDLGEINKKIASKAEELAVSARLDELVMEQKAQQAALSTKADAGPLRERHEAFAAQTTKDIHALRDAHEHLGITINGVEQSVEMVNHVASTKADEREVQEVARMSEAVQEQVTTLKQELQGTLKSLETWIMQQNTKKGQGIKLQPQPPDAPSGTTKQAIAKNICNASHLSSQPPPPSHAAIDSQQGAPPPYSQPQAAHSQRSAPASSGGGAPPGVTGGGSGGGMIVGGGGGEGGGEGGGGSQHLQVGSFAHQQEGVTQGGMQMAAPLLAAGGAMVAVPDEALRVRVAELERQLSETMLYVARIEKAAISRKGGGGASGGRCGTQLDGPFGGSFAPPASMYAVGGYGSIDASGSLALGGIDGPALFDYPHEPIEPRAARKRAPGGVTAMTASSAHAQTGKVLSSTDGDAPPEGEFGPPFRSQSDRRQWLLNEKRRWLIEMRLGNVEPDVPPSKLPPLSRVGATLSNGMSVAALVSPRAG